MTEESWFLSSSTTHIQVVQMTWYLEHGGEKKAWFFPPQDVFGIIIWLICRMITIFLLTQRARLSGPSRYLERFHKVYRKFSRGIWKKFQLKIWGFIRIFQPDFELHFSKSQLFSLFLTYNLIGVSYGHDFFTDAKRKAKRTFRIPWTPL